MDTDTTSTLEQARLTVEADRRQREEEYGAIMQREALRLRVTVLAEPFLTADGRILARVRLEAE